MKDTLTVFEQGILLTKKINGTNYLNKYSFWSSYNQPFTKAIGVYTGSSLAERHGYYFKTDMRARAKQFRAQEVFVKDPKSMAKMGRAGKDTRDGTHVHTAITHRRHANGAGKR